MLITCKYCDCKAHIKSSARVSNEIREIWCQCSNVECGHTFKSLLSFQHTISPSLKQHKQTIADLFKSLPRQEQLSLIAEVQT